MRGPEVQVLRAGFDLAVTALGSVLNDEQEPVADRQARGPVPVASEDGLGSTSWV